MGRFYKTSQKVKRMQPNYTYVIQIKSSAGWLRGFDVEVNGYSDTEDKEDNESYLTEWFWRKPAREKLMELVDRLHLSVRSSVNERDWDSIDSEEMAKKVAELEKAARAAFELELEKKVKDLLRKKKEESIIKP